MEQFSGVLLALMAAAVLIALVNGGWPRVRALGSAKFKGQVIAR
jgi:hypothetical protein